MTAIANPRKLLSQLTLSAISEYAIKRNRLPGFDWTTVTEEDRAPLLEAFDQLQGEPRNALVAELMEAEYMATEIGFRALVSEAKAQGIDLPAQFTDTQGLHDRALLTLARYHDDFWATATRYAIADALSEGKSWRKRKGVPVATPQVGAAFLEALSTDISTCYHDEGRGEHCEVEHAQRDGGQHYFFATLSDYPRNTGIFDTKTGKLRRTIQPGTYEVIIVYEAGQHTATLDIHAKGGAKIQDAIMARFSDSILRQKLPPEDPRRRKAATMNLAIFSQRPDLKLDPKDGLASVRVVALRFGRVNQAGRKHAIEIDPRKNPEADVYDEMADSMQAQAIDPQAVLPGRATLLFTEQGEAKRGNTYKVTVGFPNTCTAKSLPDARRRLAERCLKRWKIDVSGPAAHSASAGQ